MLCSCDPLTYFMELSDILDTTLSKVLHFAGNEDCRRAGQKECTVDC